MSSEYTLKSSRGRASHNLWYSNNVSLDLVDKDPSMAPAANPFLVKATSDNNAEPSDAVVRRPRAESQMPAAGPSSNQPAPIAQQPVNPIWACDMPESHAELGQYVTKCFFYLMGVYAEPRYVQLAADSDTSVILEMLAIPNLTRRRGFPWKTMHIAFGKANVNVHNWPEGVPFPPINVEDVEEKMRGKSGSTKEEKGQGVRCVAQLPKLELYFLAKAIRNEEYPLHFQVYTDGLPTGTLNAITCISRTNLSLGLLDISKSIEPLIHGEPPGPDSDKAFGRRLFANGDSDRHGLPRLRQRPSDCEVVVADNPIGNNDDSVSSKDTRTITVRPRPPHGDRKVLESDIEDFDLEAVSDDESSSGEEDPSHDPNFQRRLVRIRTSPVRPAPQSKPSYVDLSDEEMPLTLTSAQDASKPSNHGAPIAQQVVRQVVERADQRKMLPHEPSKNKGKARAVGKRKTRPDIVDPSRGQMTHVRHTV